MRRMTLITGAVGGMGRTCARQFGPHSDLILTDAIAPALEAFAQELRGEGYTVAAAIAGDLADDALLAALQAKLCVDTPLTLIHTAGLSPAQADWRAIMTVNLIATEKLLQMVEAAIVPGSVAVLIASTAGHLMPIIPDVQTLLDDPLRPGLLDAITPLVARMAEGSPAGDGGVGYSLAKQAVLRMCERRAMDWGRQGARIVSISPGMILTPMGRKEIAETSGPAAIVDLTPVGRPGIAADIALAVGFLASESASFISGCDLRVDGGWIAAMRNQSSAKL